MAGFRTLIFGAALVVGCAPELDVSACALIARPRPERIKTVVYVHSIGPDFLTAYGQGCEDQPFESVDAKELKGTYSILYIVQHSSEGYSIPYDAIVSLNQTTGKTVVSLLRRSTSLAEIKFVGDDPPKRSY